MKTPLSSCRRLCGFLVLTALVFATGCTHVEVSPGVSGEYKLGELQVFVDRNFRQVYDVAKEALNDAQMHLKRDDQKSYEAVLIARDPADAHVVVKIKQVAPNRTSVKIRHGLLNPDLPQAQALYDSMQKRW